MHPLSEYLLTHCTEMQFTSDGQTVQIIAVIDRTTFIHEVKFDPEPTVLDRSLSNCLSNITNHEVANCYLNFLANDYR